MAAFTLDDLEVGFVAGRQRDGQFVLSFLGDKQGADLLLLLGLAQTAVDVIRHHRDLNLPSLRQDLVQLAAKLLQEKTAC